jgi:DNA-binding NarL/FixJ family response regulator
MATALGAAGELPASGDALRDALRLLPAEAYELRGPIVAFIALIEQLLGHHDEAHALLLEPLATQPDPRSPAATALRIELANERYFVSDWTAMRRYAAEALSAARELADPPLITAAAAMMALADYHASRTRAAKRQLDEAAAHLDALEDAQLAGRLDAGLFTAWGEICLERREPAHRHYARTLAVARATGQGYLLVPLLTGRAQAHAWQGDLAAAIELADEAIDASRLVANDQSLTWSLTLRCWIATLAGDTADAIRLGDQAAEAAQGLTETVWGALVGCYLAEARLEAGDHHGCHTLLLDSLGGSELPWIERAFRSRPYEILTRAALASGRPHDAERYARGAEISARGLGLHGRTSEALRARAAVLLAAGAARTARAAARAAHHAGNRLDEARAQLLAGTALAADGQRQQATVALTSAEATFADCGAQRFRDQAAYQLRRLGGRVARQGRRRPGRPATGPGALTDRAREVAELLCAGHTNGRIAIQLHLAPKTVETHVAHIFAKLNVRSRAAAAATLAHAEQAPTDR